MQITWNGTGSAWSTYYGNSSALLETSGHRLVMDCGYTVPGRLRQMGVGVQNIDAIFISHLHGDHIFGLEEIGFRAKFSEGCRVNLIVPEPLVERLWHNILSGTMREPEDRCNLRDYFDVQIIREGEVLQQGPWSLEIHAVDHMPHAPCYGVKIGANGKAVAFTADTKAGIAPFFYEGTEYVFHDCSFLPYFPETIHTHFEQLLDYTPEQRAKTWLVHYDDETHQRLASVEWRTIVEESGMRITESFIPIIV
ncbi:MAG: MBL fold metallo-hydrolase [Armatimonadetes bacterium]|nr:MBL fold metallo-hydrolase [Armatimonadota bacterium]